MGFSFEEFPSADYYKSDLRKILKYIREIEKYIETWDSVITELRAEIARLSGLSNEVIDLEKRVTKLEPIVAKLKSDVTFILKNLEEINDWQELTDAKMVILSTRIDNLRLYVDDVANTLRVDYNGKLYLLNLKMNQMRVQLMEYINGLIERMEYIITHLSSDVRDPVTDTRITFDDNNMLVYDRLTYGCITEEEFSELGLTETQFANYGFTQLQFALESAKILGMYRIFGAVSGVRKSHEQAIAELVTWLCATMTETEFTAMNLTEEEFEALNLTHEQYLKYNTSRGDVVIDPNGIGLTEAQYEKLTVG